MEQRKKESQQVDAHRVKHAHNMKGPKVDASSRINML